MSINLYKKHFNFNLCKNKVQRKFFEMCENQLNTFTWYDGISVLACNTKSRLNIFSEAQEISNETLVFKFKLISTISYIQAIQIIKDKYFE